LTAPIKERSCLTVLGFFQATRIERTFLLQGLRPDGVSQYPNQSVS
jgi:hypothetical protein